MSPQIADTARPHHGLMLCTHAAALQYTGFTPELLTGHMSGLINGMCHGTEARCCDYEGDDGRQTRTSPSMQLHITVSISNTS